MILKDASIINDLLLLRYIDCFGEDNTQIDPVLFFKGKSQMTALEKARYAEGVRVFFTPKVVINCVKMDK
jgi:hypothetical protein